MVKGQRTRDYQPFVGGAEMVYSMGMEQIQMHQHQQQPAEIPRGFYCPLTQAVMFEPVLDLQGHSYERVAVEAWLQLYQTSPVTKDPMEIRALVPNRAMKEVISDFMGKEWEEKKKKDLPTGSVVEFVANTRRPRISSHTCEYRITVDSYLEDISNKVNVVLALDDDGKCDFQYEHLQFRVEVGPGCNFFTFSCRSLVDDISNRTKDRILRLNHYQTRGASVSLSNWPEGERIKLVYIKGVEEVKSSIRFGCILEDFLEKAMCVHHFLSQPQVSDSSDSSEEDERRRKRKSCR
jgi:hypothetical protein